MSVIEAKKRNYKERAIFWAEQINKINNLSKEQLLQLDPDNDPFYTRMCNIDCVIDLSYKNLVNYIALLNGGIIFEEKQKECFNCKYCEIYHEEADLHFCNKIQDFIEFDTAICKEFEEENTENAFDDFFEGL